VVSTAGYRKSAQTGTPFGIPALGMSLASPPFQDRLIRRRFDQVHARIEWIAGMLHSLAHVVIGSRVLGIKLQENVRNTTLMGGRHDLLNLNRAVTGPTRLSKSAGTSRPGCSAPSFSRSSARRCTSAASNPSGAPPVLPVRAGSRTCSRARNRQAHAQRRQRSGGRSNPFSATFTALSTSMKKCSMYSSFVHIGRGAEHHAAGTYRWPSARAVLQVWSGYRVCMGSARFVGNPTEKGISYELCCVHFRTHVRFWLRASMQKVHCAARAEITVRTSK